MLCPTLRVQSCDTRDANVPTFNLPSFTFRKISGLQFLSVPGFILYNISAYFVKSLKTEDCLS